VVVTGAPRKRLVRKGTWVRIPPSPPHSPRECGRSVRSSGFDRHAFARRSRHAMGLVAWGWARLEVSIFCSRLSRADSLRRLPRPTVALEIEAPARRPCHTVAIPAARFTAAPVRRYEAVNRIRVSLGVGASRTDNAACQTTDGLRIRWHGPGHRRRHPAVGVPT
jgi:hypothetical protein